MISDEEEVESFEITDYDLQSELNPGMRKRQTKEQAIYGIWATSDDETEGTHQRGSKIRKSNYTDPMGFVSGGTFDQQDKDADPLEIKNEVKEEVTEPEVKTRQTFRDVQARYQKNTKKFGAWEKYTTGFGSKMLEKMGYKGKGLGKGGEGIIEPVQAFKRGGRAAIGAYGSEKPDEMPIIDQEEEEEIEIKKEIEKLHQWKKTGQETKKPKYVYKTADEVKKSGSSKKLAPLLNYGNVKVVDMTGPETKVLQGYSSLANQHAKPEDSEKNSVIDIDEKQTFELPELIYNLNLLVDLAESEIIQIDRQLRFENDNIVNMGHELDRLTSVCNEEENEIDNLQNVLKIVERCKDGMDPNEDKPLTLESLIKCFQVIRESYYEEYKLYDLEKLVIPLGFPLLVRHFATWRPFSEPTYGIEVVKLWKEVLEEEKNNMEFTNKTNEQRSMGPFERLIWEVWMPHLRSAVGQWKAKDCDPLITVMEAWVHLIPEWIVANILDQLVMPKLQTAVDVWNPLLDTTPIHSWIHPWLPLMGQRLEPLYGPIRQKIAAALTNWHPSDPSAKVILEPWVKVFSKGTMEAFLLRSVFPKLECCMNDFTINPHQQLLDPFHWVMSWKGIISVHHMVSILDKYLFPKWLQVLRKWLTSEPNYDEVTKWYLGWKAMFSEEFISNPTIKEHFNRALTLMNQSVSGTLQPGAKENVAYLTNTERRREAEQAAIKAEKMKTASTLNYGSMVPTRFKDLIEQAAEENGLLFIPLPNRRHEGKTVYSFGKCVIYIDRDVVFLSTEGTWKPSSLQDLLDIAR